MEQDLLLDTIKKDKEFEKNFRELHKSKHSPKKEKKPKSNTEVSNEMSQLNIKCITTYFREKQEVRSIFEQCSKMIKLLLTVPGSSCTNEERDVFMSHLRSTMSQTRLTDA